MAPKKDMCPPNCFSKSRFTCFCLRFVGEEDMQGYDISRLQIPMGDTDSMIKGPPPEEPMMYRREMMPVGSKYSNTPFEQSLTRVQSRLV